MKTQTKYEEIILNEIRSLPPPVLPQAVRMLRSLRDGVRSVGRSRSVTATESTGFCGAWKGARTVDEIIAEITAHRPITR